MDTTKPIKSERALKFVEEYVRDRNASQAALRAGYSPKCAHAQGHRLLKDAEIAALIDARKVEAGKEALIEAADVLKQWVLIATADPAKISRVRQLNCRHCHGKDHEYQWTTWEFASACDSAAVADPPRPPPSCAGGFGWVFNAEPVAACPRCHGEGVENVYFEDMDKLGPAERRLVAGVKRTKDGLEIKYRDQDAALSHLAKYLGMMPAEKREITGKNGGPLVAATVPVELPGDAVALASLYAQIVGG